MISCEIVKHYYNKWVALEDVVKEDGTILAGTVVESADTFEEMTKKLDYEAMLKLTLRYVTGMRKLLPCDCVLWADSQRVSMSAVHNEVHAKKYLLFYDCKYKNEILGTGGSAIFAGETDSPAVRDYMMKEYNVVVHNNPIFDRV